MTQAPLTVTASSGSMTYGGTPPGVIPAYAGFVNGDTPSSLTTAGHLFDHGNELEPSLAPDVPDDLHGCVGSQLRRLVRRRERSRSTRPPSPSPPRAAP